MIQLLRKLIDSKLGVAFALGFLVLIAFAFAASDMASLSGSGGGTGDKIASVGNQSITSSQVNTAANTALESLKKENPQLSMKAFAAGGGVEKVLEQLLSRVALSEFGKKSGIIASERLIDSEIAKLPGFQGADGTFSDKNFRQVLAQQGISERALRDDMAQGLIVRQLIVPAQTGSVASQELATRYTALVNERRSGAIGLIPSAAFAPKTPPSDAELQAYYAKNSNSFIRPERRIIRYASFDETALKSIPSPTDAEVAAKYNADKSKYAALESRRITQLIAPTQAAADALIAEIRQGKKMEQVAASKGLSASSLGSINRETLASQTSSAVADAAFAAASGALAAPARSALGWHVIHIDGIENRPARSLEQARGEIVAGLIATKRRAALNDLSANIDDEFSNGGNLAETAKSLGLTLQVTPAVTADGQIYGQQGASLPPVLAKLITTAFAMERENKPQLAEVEAGKTFIIFDVTTITASAPAPFAEIRGDIVIMAALEKGASSAKAAADKVLAMARKKIDISVAMAGLGLPLPPVDRVSMARTDLAKFQQQRQAVPPPLMMLFSMAKGTTKLLPAPNNRGWYVVAVNEIIPGKIDSNDPVLIQTRSELGRLMGNEYAEQLARAASTNVGVKRNDAALKALRNQLAGNGN